MTQEEQQPPSSTSPSASPSPSPSSSPEKPKRKTQVLHEQLLQRLPSNVQRALQPSATAPVVRDPEESEYQRLLQRLPLTAQVAIRELGPKPPEPPKDYRPQWCVCECADEDFPRVRIFDSPQKLARYLAGLEGKDIAIWPFFGMALRITKPIGGQRYLILPGEQEALPLKSYGKLEPVDASFLNLEELTEDEAYQCDGWVGDPALDEASTPEHNLGNEEMRRRRRQAKEQSRRPKKTKEENEDEDEPPEGAESN